MSKKYLVGNSENGWDFESAYQDAEDGDVIIFEPDYCYHLESDMFFEISKSLEFIGNITQEDDKTYFSNTIFSKIVISDGVSVKFSNLYFQIDGSNNNFSIYDGSKVELYYVTIENLCESSECHFLCLENESELYADNTWLWNHSNTQVSLDHASAIFKNSSLSTAISTTSSALTLENVSVEKFGNNVINAKDSHITLRDCNITGGENEEALPALVVKHSNIFISDSYIDQNHFSSCVYVLDNSYLFTENSELTSVDMHSSRGMINHSVIKENIFLSAGSYVVNTDEIELFGENPEIIEILVDDHSCLVCDKIVFSQSSNKIVRLTSRSHLKTQQFVGENIQFQVEEDSSLIDCENLSKKSVDKNAQGKNAANSSFKKVSMLKSSAEGSNSREKLNHLIGLEQVKKEISKMIGIVDFNNLRISQGLEPEKMALHCVFMGNPGTGKTMVARLIGEVLYESGVLPGEEFIFVEASESDLISSNVGGTAEQTQHILDKAKGGILFIDEAYTLNKKDANINHGQEAINTILKYMEDYRDEIMIIFAGYTKEMEEFLRTNPGLESRVPNKFIFEDYTSDEMIEMGMKFLNSKKYRLDDEEYYKRNVKHAYASSLDKSNGRWIRNFNEKIIKSLANRVSQEKSTDVITIKNCDIDDVLSASKYNKMNKKDRDALEELDGMIGISSVKEKVREFIALAEFNKKRMDQGQVVSGFTLHSKFLGNPGTGKTTVARIVGEVLYQKGIISQNKFIEVSRSDLIAGYVGQTAIKTREVLQSALGGVLFIDEAYSLNSSNSDFAVECVDEILKFMEDHRNDMVIIFAGYTEEMNEFLNMNAGLNSRVPNTFIFEDYSEDEIVQIGLLILHKYGYVVDEVQYANVVKQSYLQSNDNSNGRWIRNFNEQLMRYMSSRVSREGAEDLNTITSEDLDKMLL